MVHKQMCAEGSPSCWLTNISNQSHGDPSPHQLMLLLIGLCQCPAQAQHSSAELFHTCWAFSQALLIHQG